MLGAIRRIIRWSGPRGRRLYMGFVYSFFNTIFTALPIMAAAYGLNLLLQDARGENAITADWALYMLIFMIAAVMGRFLFAYLRASVQESIGCEVTAEERIKIGDVLKKVSLGFFSQKNTGEIASAVTTDLSFFEMLGIKMVDTVVGGYISAFTMVLCMAFYNPYTALIATGGILLSALFLKMLGKKCRENAPVHQTAQDNIVGATVEYIRGMQVVKSFGQEGASFDGIGRAYRSSRDINIKLEKIYVPYNCLHLFALKAASVGIVLLSALLAMRNTMDISTMLMMAIFSFVIFGHVETINGAVHVLEIVDATLNKLESIEKANPIDKDGKDRTPDTFDIAFKNVTFAYDKRDVLSDVSFFIPQNTTAAIIGPSGGGKSTICSLIARFYDAGCGSVTIGGLDVKGMTCDSLMKNISMVFQKVYLFRDTILNNIRFGKPDATLDEVMAAARSARCHDFIEALPQGYDTMVGDGGATLSGGEKQRISIARAMLKNAPVIILDEATASVDPENEQAIQAAISALVHGKTMIIIAHRLATIRSADQILVVDKGRIVQRGTHEELALKEGVYSKFMRIREAAEGWSIE